MAHVNDVDQESDEAIHVMSDSDDDVAARAQMEFDTTMASNTYVPGVLQKWKNWCIKEKGAKNISLTPENACRYAQTGSSVGWKGRVEHALPHMEKDSEMDANLLASLLECVITTVIGLATDQGLPDEYLYCSLIYLQHIKDEFGEKPPNIAAFMKVVESKLNDEYRETLKKMGKAELRLVPPNIVITRLPKSLRKRLCK